MYWMIIPSESHIPESRGRVSSDRAHRMRLTTLREFTMMQLMNLITDKPEWNIKVKYNLHTVESSSQYCFIRRFLMMP
jgi:hypothetical protein